MAKLMCIGRVTADLELRESVRKEPYVVLPNYGLPYVFVERLADLERIRPGDFVLVTLNKLRLYQKQIKKWVKRRNQKICFTLDESDEISNPDSQRWPVSPTTSAPLWPGL